MKFIIKFNLFNKDKDVEEILNIIKIIKSSENKKGAFILTLYQDYNIIVNKSTMDEFTSLRNQIIHDGRFIGYDLVYSYCKKIYNFINEILRELSKIFVEENYIKFDFALQEYFNKINPNDKHIVATSVPSILNSLGTNEVKTFDKKIWEF